MKPIVIYESKYGSTAKYALMIASSLGCEAIKSKEVNNLSSYDVVIYGEGLYAGQLHGLERLIKKIDSESCKKLIVFTVGLSDPNVRENIERISPRVKAIVQNRLCYDLYFLRGSIDYKKLSFVHKAMMAMLVKSIKCKKERSKEDEELLSTYKVGANFISKESIYPILDAVKKID